MPEETETLTHPEWERENSLTSNEDRDIVNRWTPAADKKKPPLTQEEKEAAVKALNNTDFIDKFPRVDRTYADPHLPMQYIGLFSFTPAKGAKPNENGVYGFAKLRGNFPTEYEAKERADFLIETHDSYHQIYHPFVGRPFPVTNSSRYSAHTDEVEIRKEMTKAMSTNIKNQKQDDQKQIKEIYDRQEKLIEESKKDEDDPIDVYTTLRNKKAQITWLYLEHQNKLIETKEIIIKTRKQIKEMDQEYPEFQNVFFEKFKKTREDTGIKDKPDALNSCFMKYIMEDAILPGIDDVEKVENEQGDEESKVQV